MKKIIGIITVVATLGLLLSACNLDRYPTDRIVNEQAFQTFEDAERFRNGVYNELRRVRYGIFTTTTELMSDLFNASVGFGGRGAAPHRLYTDFTGATEPRDIWGNVFGAIAQVNNFINNVEGVTATAEQREQIADFVAEAHYARAFLYYILATHFMYPYSPENRNTPELGMPLLRDFDVTARPGRATIAETFAFILEDLEAAEAISTVGAPRSIRITRDAVHALKARVYFMMGNNARAAHYAEMLIASARYPLVRTEEALRRMWINDDSSEDIFKLQSTQTATGAFRTNWLSETAAWTLATMSIFSTWDNAASRFAPDFLPTQTVIDLYGDGDMRLNVFFSDPETQIVRYGGIDRPGVRVLHKFPGNPALFTTPGITNYRHHQRMHRIAEMYLISAEAGRNLHRLNELRVARGASELGGFGPDDQYLRDEWVREFVGEGHRIESLRRWGIGFDGRVPQDPLSVSNYGGGFYTNRHVTPIQFYRFTLPIPSNDLQTNPNLRQTPSWVNPQ